MKHFTTNMALKGTFKKNKRSEQFKSEELSKSLEHKLKLIEKAFR